MPQVRNLGKKHTLVFLNRGKRHKGAVFFETPNGLVQERRRLNPAKAGALGSKGVVHGLAEDLFVPLGPERRDLGTKRHAANVRRRKNLQARRRSG